MSELPLSTQTCQPISKIPAIKGCQEEGNAFSRRLKEKQPIINCTHTASHNSAAYSNSLLAATLVAEVLRAHIFTVMVSVRGEIVWREVLAPLRERAW